MLQKIKKLVALDNPIRLGYHHLRAVIANVVYGFPHKDMVIIGVTGTNGKTTTCNIIAKGLEDAWKKVFMFSTVNIIMDGEEHQNDTKMTSPDVFELQRLLKVAKQKWCTHAVIETASHGIKMNRIWGLNYDICVLTNITQDHLDLHKTMKDYVDTKLEIFKNLISYKRKPNIKKTAIINHTSNYVDLFLAETYDTLYTYGWNQANLVAKNIVQQWGITTFDIAMAGPDISIKTSLIWDFNIQNILAAVWVFISLGMGADTIRNAIEKCRGIPGRMEQVDNSEWYNIFVDYAHTEDALEKVLINLQEIKQKDAKIITVFGATGDRDRTKRATMGKIVSDLSDSVILTEDDNYSEKIEEIIKDILPGIERKQWEDFWVITSRKEAIITALTQANPGDIILIAWKWDEHALVTNNGHIPWHDKTIVKEILASMDDNKIM